MATASTPPNPFGLVANVLSGVGQIMAISQQGKSGKSLQDTATYAKAQASTFNVQYQLGANEIFRQYNSPEGINDLLRTNKEFSNNLTRKTAYNNALNQYQSEFLKQKEVTDFFGQYGGGWLGAVIAPDKGAFDRQTKISVEETEQGRFVTITGSANAPWSGKSKTVIGADGNEYMHVPAPTAAVHGQFMQDIYDIIMITPSTEAGITEYIEAQTASQLNENATMLVKSTADLHNTIINPGLPEYKKEAVYKQKTPQILAQTAEAYNRFGETNTYTLNGLLDMVGNLAGRYSSANDETVVERFNLRRLVEQVMGGQQISLRELTTNMQSTAYSIKDAFKGDELNKLNTGLSKQQSEALTSIKKDVIGLIDKLDNADQYQVAKRQMELKRTEMALVLQASSGAVTVLQNQFKLDNPTLRELMLFAGVDLVGLFKDNIMLKMTKEGMNTFSNFEQTTRALRNDTEAMKQRRGIWNELHGIFKNDYSSNALPNDIEAFITQAKFKELENELPHFYKLIDNVSNQIGTSVSGVDQQTKVNEAVNQLTVNYLALHKELKTFGVLDNNKAQDTIPVFAKLVKAHNEMETLIQTHLGEDDKEFQETLKSIRSQSNENQKTAGETSRSIIDMLLNILKVAPSDEPQREQNVLPRRSQTPNVTPEQAKSALEIQKNNGYKLYDKFLFKPTTSEK